MNRNRENRIISIWILILSMLLSMAVHAKTPLAGTLIKNQATATYKDAAGVEQFATSNVVETLIQQVGAMELVQDQSRLAVAGNTVYMPHVLTNTGNGDDSYNLSASNITGDNYDFDLGTVAFYADANKDGVPDNTTPITSTGLLSSEEAFYFVMSVLVPATAATDDYGMLTIKGESTHVETPVDLIVEQTNTDTVTVTDQGVIEVTKSISANSGASPSGPYTVTLKYSNIGLTAVTDLLLKDTLPAGMSYNTGADSARWSVTGAGVALTDTDANDAQGSGDTIRYCAYNPGCDTNVTATISQVPAGASGELTFEVNIDSGLDASTLLNIADFSYTSGSTSVPLANTNQVPFEITQQPDVVANGSESDPTDGADNQGGTSDAFIVDSASRGAAVLFDNIIRNTGNTDDTFEITIDDGSNTFPPGTGLQLLQSDGFTPLMDTNNDGTVDTGILSPGESYKVVLRAVLPANVTGNNGGSGFEVTKIATSALDNSVFNDVTDRLGEITLDSVDLTNNAAGAGADGWGAGPEGSAVTTETIAPGEQAVFNLFVNNTSDAANSYELQYSMQTPFVSGTLQSGWNIAFHFDGGNGDCSTLGQITSATGNISAGGNKQICAAVAVPANAIADGSEIPVFFKAVSSLTGASDIKYDAVQVEEKPALTIEPDQVGQIEPGGTTVYSHRVANNGNTALECISVMATDLEPQSGWTSLIYLDVNEDGALDAGDTLLTNQTLDPGEAFPVLIKLFAPATDPMGSQNVQQLTVTGHQDDGDSDPNTCNGALLTDQAKDVTTVATSSVSITKEQAPDLDCDGVADAGAYSTTSFQVDPGACVVYKLTAVNRGATPVNNARIDDAAPSFTEFFGSPSVTHGNISGGVAGTDGNITGGSIGGTSVTLAPGESMVLDFGVKLD